MKTGKDIKDLHDIRMMIAYLCVTENNFTKDKIYNMARKNLKGSYIMADKLLKTITSKVVDFLIKQNLLIENNGLYCQVSKNDVVLEYEDQNIYC